MSKDENLKDDTKLIPKADCPGCDNQYVREGPEAGYAICINCGERGSRRGDRVEWWRNDPESSWYIGDPSQ